MWPSVCAILLSFQIEGSILPRLLDKQPLTRSLLSGSEASHSRSSHSGGGSCFATPYSKPYVLCSATDAASAAIDFSKENVEEGVVDSPPSRGLARTPICSPSPLKRIASTPSRMRSQSPAQLTEFTPNRKLYKDDTVEAIDLRVEDGIPLLPVVGHHVQQSGDLMGMSIWENRKKNAHPGAYIAGRSSRPLPSRSLPLKSMSEKSAPIVVPLNRRNSLGNYQGSDRSPSTGTANLCINTSSRPPVQHPPGGCRSHSTDGLSRCERKRHRNETNQLLKLGAFGPVFSASERFRPSRREDILRGYAKVKALEAANSSSSTKKEG